ncbi:MAG: hypothetical protein IPM01_26785 [Burkholderiaceae bacterium]|nr:hypothetical protein [Burkholderiaceae bacterium]
MDPLASTCRLELNDTAAALHLSGEWRLGALTGLSDALAKCDLAQIGSRALVVDGGSVTALDTAGALLFLRRVVQAGADPAALELRGFDARHARIVDVVRERLGGIGTRRRAPTRRLIASFGAHLVELRPAGGHAHRLSGPHARRAGLAGSARRARCAGASCSRSWARPASPPSRWCRW